MQLPAPTPTHYPQTLPAAPAPADFTQQALALVRAAVVSPATQRAYIAALLGLFSFHNQQGGGPLVKSAVMAWRGHMVAAGLAPATINQRLSAVRLLARELIDALDGHAAAPGVTPEQMAQIAARQRALAAICRVPGIKRRGQRLGRWLSKEDAERLINAPGSGPGPRSLRDIRDRALLGLAFGSGLRRAELAAVEWGHIQQRAGRWVIVDMAGKGGRVRTVPIPVWAVRLLDAWGRAAGSRAGRVFLRITRGGRATGQGISSQTVYDVIRRTAAEVGIKLAAHDTRRTWARLAAAGGAELAQIQITLGHSSIATTERYLGLQQRLELAPCDVLGIAPDPV
jgi:integrase